MKVKTKSQGCPRLGNDQGKRILQGHGKVREFYFESGKLTLKKVRDNYNLVPRVSHLTAPWGEIIYHG